MGAPAAGLGAGVCAAGHGVDRLLARERESVGAAAHRAVVAANLYKLEQIHSNIFFLQVLIDIHQY